MSENYERLGLWSEDDQCSIPLKGVYIQAEIQDLLSEVSVSQTFTNAENKNIEAVFTFPLPIDAVLLSFSVTLNEKHLIGTIQERKQAEENYEEAIVEGNTAILLQQVEAGLYTVNIGNLTANETAVIAFQYTQLHNWTEDVLRWHIPTVLAPRFGQPVIEPQQVPDVDILVEHTYTLSVAINGLLKRAIIESPSHGIDVKVKDENTIVQLQEGRAFLDRDLILNFRLSSDKVSAVCDKDIDGYVALASFCPTGPAQVNNEQENEKQSRLIKLLVDCSGSMTGESIAQARVALLNIIESLNERDQFLLIRFGSSIAKDIPKPLQATKENIIHARNVIAKIDADLGGTEIFIALEQTIKLAKNNESADILLITDGEIWDDVTEKSHTQKMIELANKNQQRIFTVGVGSSVSERIVRELAEGTQGACELVNPEEGMAEKIERHFKRIYADQAKSITVEWPTQPFWQTPVQHYFTGDTLHVFARFTKKPTGTVKLIADFGSEQMMQQTADITVVETDEEITTLARIAANQKLKGIEYAEEKISLAIKYQLMCKETAYLIVDVKPEDLKTDGMPELRKVPHMLTSGWGGIGQVDMEMSYLCESPSEYVDVPVFLRRQSGDTSVNKPSKIMFSKATPRVVPEVRRAKTIPSGFVNSCKSFFKLHWLSKKLVVRSFEDLLDADLPDAVFDVLQGAIDLSADKNTEQQVIVAFFYYLLRSPAGIGFSIKEKASIEKSFQCIEVNPDIQAYINNKFKNMDESWWGFSVEYFEDDEE